jgi:hypothetical protein
MRGKITRDLCYGEIFADSPGVEPSETAILANTEMDFLNQHEDTCLIMLEDEKGTLYYADVPTNAIEFMEES